MEVPEYSPYQRADMDPRGPYVPPQTIRDMSDEQFGYTFDKDLRKANPYQAMRKGFNPFNPPSLTDNVANWVGEMGNKGIRGIGNVAQSGALGAGAMGIGLGGLGGYGIYKWLTRNKADSDTKKQVAGVVGPTASAILGAALLGGAALSANSYRTKNASSGDLVGQIQRSNLSHKEKQDLINGVRKLSNEEKDRLSRSTRGIVGAALGAAVARYLRSKGLLPMIVGGMIGGALGWSSFSTPKRPTTPFYIPKYGS